MKDYKYVIPDIDIKSFPADEIILHKGEVYEIEEIHTGDNGAWMIKIKNFDIWKLNCDLKLLTVADMRRLKIKKFINKII